MGSRPASIVIDAIIDRELRSFAMNFELADHLRVADHHEALRLGAERMRGADRGHQEQPGKEKTSLKWSTPAHRRVAP